MEIRPILSSLRRHKTAALLIVLQIALTCAIVCNALFLIQQRIERMSIVSGVAENELVRVQPASLRVMESEPGSDTRTSTEHILSLLRQIPGVTSVAAVGQMPFGNSSNNSGVNLSPDQVRNTLNATTYMDGGGMLETFGLRLSDGRAFAADEYVDLQDVLGGNAAVPAAIVNRTTAERLFPGESAVGKQFYVWGNAPITIVGVVEELIRPNNFGLGQYSVIFPLRNYYQGIHYMLRTDPGRRDEVLQAANDVLKRDDPSVIMLGSDTMENTRSDFFRQDRSMIWMLSIVCLALLVVTAFGIVGLASFWVQQRTRQIGVRRALGATKGQILRYFQAENFLLASAGIVLGMLLAYALNQFLMGRYELPRLPVYYLPVGAAALWLLGQLAVLGPARRAASVSPAIATRSA
ncbi:ABC transporter permease [Luteimonas sp. BDR2-5]|uniref:ABC transporter permease n=1 Tax=Proluteimonas luteida TaxID=2878685 RepID=UPI001E60B828|nr:ABC transporter permease [Luteimonas sp. BDR2-5]MCD9029925.1 ABC transporter permease [Luteimonas sp. BDR2-5]